MERYTTLANEVIEYAKPAPDVAAFLARVNDAAHNPTVPESELVGLIYGLENPVLDKDVLPGRAMVTQAVFDDPVYRVMCDLLDRKRIQVGTLDLEAAHADYTMTVPEAAAEIGISEDGVRKAIKARRLNAMKKGGRWVVHPDSVASFKIGHRVKPAHADDQPLQLRFGSAPGRSFRVKYAGAFERTKRDGEITEGELRGWKRMAIIAGPTGNYRTYVLEPGSGENEVAWDDFYARGRFAVVKQVDGGGAREAFKAFAPR